MYFHNEKQREADFKKHVECKLCSTKQLVEKPDPRGSWMDSRGRRASSVVPMRPSTGRFWMHLAGGCSVAWMTGHSGRESPENRLNWIYIYIYIHIDRNIYIYIIYRLSTSIDKIIVVGACQGN